MSDRRWVPAFVLLLISLPGLLSAQQLAAWHDPSPHTVQFVTVDKDVKLEVLDWGGTGRPVVLLTGLGDTAHTFDDFAPKLTPEYHVYGITRRGYGASSAPASGYSADRLGDDVLAVLDALKLDRPVLVGHSIGGEELSSVGTRHPERVAGLVYLDAGYPYALYDPSRGDFLDSQIDLNELRRKWAQMRLEGDMSTNGPLIQDLLQTIVPAFEKDLQEMQERLRAAPPLPPLIAPPEPTAADRASFAAWQSYEKRIDGLEIPEAELRQTHETNPDGHVGPQKTNAQVRQGIIDGMQKFTEIRVPVLAIFAIPNDLGVSTSNPAALAAYEASETAHTEATAKAFETHIPSARVVRLPHAQHYVYMSNEADVLREMRTFLAGLH